MTLLAGPAWGAIVLGIFGIGRAMPVAMVTATKDAEELSHVVTYLGDWHAFATVVNAVGLGTIAGLSIALATS